MGSKPKTKILMVCLGNICRSPLAEGIMQQKINARSLNAETYSSGTSNYHISEPADPRTIAIARHHGVDITTHRVTQFKADDFDKYDMIFVMDNSNMKSVLRLARTESDYKKVRLIMSAISDRKSMEVPDPYYSDKEGFELVYNMLDEACEKIADELENL